ncbi:uncharacterized protein LOC142748482 [Rhinoderma darwinii]|uniref:uncharacterized protein LOC142748482 n=1 Tax=Rhinoderma darwinii TaxID=43563 RepID=UPI003F66F237
MAPNREAVKKALPGPMLDNIEQYGSMLAKYGDLPQCLAGVFDYIPNAPVREFKIPARTWKPSWRRDYKSKDNLVHPDSAPKTAEPTIASIGLVNLENKPSPLARKGYYVKKHQPARSQDSGKRGKWNLFGVHQSKKEITTQRPKTEKKSFWDVFGKKHLPARSQDSGKRGKFNVFGRLQPEKEITTQRPKPEKKSFWDVFGKKSGSSKVQPLVPKYKNVGTQVSKEEFPEISMASRSTMTDPKIKVSMETQVEEKDFENISQGKLYSTRMMFTLLCCIMRTNNDEYHNNGIIYLSYPVIK